MRQFFNIVCRQQFPKSILRANRVAAKNNGQKMQIMVAQDDSCLRPERSELTQYSERIGSAVDEVPRQPQLVRVLKLNFVQERFQLSPTALYIANGINGHRS